jgi:hypothetical protein
MRLKGRYVRLAMAVLVAAIGCLLVLARRDRSCQQAPGRPPERGIKNASAANHGDQPPTPKHPGAPTAVIIGNQYPGDSDQQRTQRRKWRRSEILSAISAIAALAGSTFAVVALVAAWQAVSEARRQADIAQEALIIVDRPWIRVVGLSDVRLEVREHGAALTTKIKVKNIGRSPAQRTLAITRLITQRSIDDEAQEAVFLCRQSEGGYASFGELLFPNEERVFDWRLLIDMQSIRLDNERIRGHKVAEDGRENAESVPLFAAFSLIGCVIYAIPSRNFAGQTAFIYGINFACGTEGRELCAFDMAKPAVFEGRDVAIWEPSGGTFAR